MPRCKREKSESGIYHIMIRGINKQQIFHDSKDCEKFLYILSDCKEKSHFKLFAYCLMGNHIHILLQETDEPIGQIFRRIGARYVYWYNYKYQRTGHLFQDRFKSEPVETDEYFLSALAYIHNNPVKAGIVNHPSDYTYSSYNRYFGNDSLIDTDYLWKLIQHNQYETLHQKDGFEHIDIATHKERLFDSQAQEIISKYTDCNTLEEYQKMEYENQLKFIHIFKDEGLSIRQICRLTGLPKRIVEKK